MRTLFNLFIVIFCAISCVHAGNSYYVDGTNGNDGNNGLSVSAALKTVQHCANLAHAGGKKRLYERRWREEKKN
jgi:hypothetical protein